MSIHDVDAAQLHIAHAHEEIMHMRDLASYRWMAAWEIDTTNASSGRAQHSLSGI